MVETSTSVQFSARTDRRNGVARIAVRGELDLASVSCLRDQFELLDNERLTGVVLDLSALSFLDSTGLRTVLDVIRRADSWGCPLGVVGGSSEVRKVFEVTMTDELLHEREGLDLLETYARRWPAS